MRVLAHKRRFFETFENSHYVKSAARRLRPNAVSLATPFFDLLIGGGFTDDHSQTANAGGSPHSQLRSGNRQMLRPLSRGVRPALQQTAGSTRRRRDPRLPAVPAQR